MIPYVGRVVQCLIDYVRPKRFRIYGKYSNKVGSVQIIGELGKV